MEPVWAPLERRLGKARCARFMFMGRLNGINRYKHGITRTNLFLDDEDNCYLPGKSGSFVRADWDTELGKLEASLTTLGWTLNTLTTKTSSLRNSTLCLNEGFRC
jgi:hypothetical protein